MKVTDTMSNSVETTERYCHSKIWRSRTQCQIWYQQKGVVTVKYEGQEHNIKYCVKRQNCHSKIWMLRTQCQIVW